MVGDHQGFPSETLKFFPLFIEEMKKYIMATAFLLDLFVKVDYKKR